MVVSLNKKGDNMTRLEKIDAIKKELALIGDDVLINLEIIKLLVCNKTRNEALKFTQDTLMMLDEDVDRLFTDLGLEEDDDGCDLFEDFIIAMAEVYKGRRK